jgi:hypothetical protein
MTAHNQRLSKTRSIPYWTTSVFSSTATDLALIYESATSSASVIRWLRLRSWTLKSLTNSFLNSLTNRLIHAWILFHKLGWTDERSPSRRFRALHYYYYYLCFVRCYETCRANRCPAIDYSASIRYSGNVCLTWPWLAMNFRSVSVIPGFRCHITIMLSFTAALRNFIAIMLETWKQMFSILSPLKLTVNACTV